MKSERVVRKHFWIERTFRARHVADIPRSRSFAVAFIIPLRCDSASSSAVRQLTANYAIIERDVSNLRGVRDFAATFCYFCFYALTIPTKRNGNPQIVAEAASGRKMLKMRRFLSETSDAELIRRWTNSHDRVTSDFTLLTHSPIT